MNIISVVSTNRQLQLLALSILICCATPAKAKTATPIAESSTRNQQQVGYDYWGFKEGAPDQVSALARTNDGYLWIGSSTGLFRFDGQRFERYRSPLGAELVSTNISGLFAPPSGGLWIGYRFGGFSFLKDGRLTNYAASSGTVLELTQGEDGVVWANTTSGIWRFEYSEWKHLGAESGALKDGQFIAFDRAGYLWAKSDTTIVYLAPGAKRFEVAEQNVKTAGYQHTAGFIYDADGFVVTSKSWRPRSAIRGSR